MASNNLRWAIEEVMKKSNNNLIDIGMGDPDSDRKNPDFRPVASHTLIFQSQQAQLEEIYFWILDFMSSIGWKMEKIVDNFTASPGSGQFSELSMKATKMQEEGMKILGGLNQVVKSVLNLIYDLKEFEMRLKQYEEASSEDPKKKQEGLLALKQIWLDNVDIKRQRGSIHMMAAELGFTTIREAFMMANTQEDLDKMNDDNGGGIINDQVKRILIPRINEFNTWVNYSRKELQKRFDIEKSYLKSQVETIKMYSAWMKPYFEAAEKLKQQGFDNNAALVNAFSTSMFELQLFGKKSVSEDSSYKGAGFKSRRGYNQVILIKLEYRGHVSQRVTQRGDYGFAMGGKVEMKFDAFVLNDEELEAAQKLVEKESLASGLSFSADVADDALKTLKEDLDYFLKSDEEKKKEEEAKEAEKKDDKKSQDINPFTALFGGGKKKEKAKSSSSGEKKEVVPEEIKKDNYVEKTMRAAAIEEVAGKLYLVYDLYKKTHGMASSPDAMQQYDGEIVDNLSQGGGNDLKTAIKGLHGE